MSPTDELELHRISALLAEVNGSLPENSPLREGLVKAGLALGLAFINGQRGWIDNEYAQLDADISEE